MNCKTILYRFIFLCAATLVLGACNSGGNSMDNSPPPSPTPTPTPTPTPVTQTWFFSDGAGLTAGQINSFDTQGLYFNAHSAANPGGEIRGQIVPSSTTFATDAGNPATSNTFSTLMSGDQKVPVNSSTATGYATIVLNPTAKTISGVLVTNGIVGTAAHTHDAAVGVNGSVIIPLTGGPTVWTVPAGQPVTDDQIAKLKAGTLYVNAHTAGAPGGEIRGQLTQQLRFAAMSGANEVPAVTTAAAGTGVLALNPTTGAIRGFVKTTGITGTVAHIHEAAAGAATGAVIVPMTQTPDGSGIWVIPAGQVLTASQMASFNAGNLYFNVHSAANPGGEIRGPIVAATVKIGNAALDGSKEVPPVTTTATGTGIMVLNSITKLVAGNLLTSGITGTAAHVHEAATGVAGPVIVPLTLTPPPSTLVPLVSTTSLANGAVGSAYSQTLTATGGTTPYTWAVATGTLPAGLNLSAAGVISGTPTAAGSSSFTVRVTDSASPAVTATQALSLTITAAPVVLAVTTTSVANGAVGSAYSQTLTATGGTTPYTWAVATGTLPAGLSLSAAGVISGTPSAAGSFTFNVSVTDSASPAATAAKAVALTVAAAPVGVSFSTQIQPIFTANCTTGCHSPGGISSFMNLTAGNAYASLVLSSPPRVIAGSSATSLLYQRITGAVQPQMPLGGTPLSATDQTLIKNWIDQGAANN